MGNNESMSSTGSGELATKIQKTPKEKEFTFNICICGSSGSGKTTLFKVLARKPVASSQMAAKATTAQGASAGTGTDALASPSTRITPSAKSTLPSPAPVAPSTRAAGTPTTTAAKATAPEQKDGAGTPSPTDKATLPKPSGTERAWTGSSAGIMDPNNLGTSSSTRSNAAIAASGGRGMAQSSSSTSLAPCFEVVYGVVNGVKCKFELQDNTGDPKYRPMVLDYAKSSNAILLLVDLTSPNAKKNAEALLKWILDATKNKKDVFLIGNKNDVQEPIVQKNIAKLQELASAAGVKFYSISALMKKNLTEAAKDIFNDVASKVIAKKLPKTAVVSRANSPK